MTARLPAAAGSERVRVMSDLIALDKRQGVVGPTVVTELAPSPACGCGLELSAFPTRRAFADHRAVCSSSKLAGALVSSSVVR